MDAKEGKLSCPHLFTAAGGTWAMAQSCKGCQKHQPQEEKTVMAGDVLHGCRCPPPGVWGLGTTRGAGRGMWAGRGQEREQRGPRAPSGGFTHCLP